MQIRFITKKRAQAELARKKQDLAAGIARADYIGKALSAMRGSRDYIRATMPPVRYMAEQREKLLTQLDELLEGRNVRH